MDCPAVLAPFTAACSGVGQCVDATSCACPEGLSGASDWALGMPTCAISLTAVKVMYAILAVAQFAQLLFALFFLSRLRKSALISRKKRNNELYMGGIFISLSSCCMFAMAIMRASNPGDPSNTVGNSPAVTVLFIGGVSSGWSYVLVFLRHMLSIALDQLRMQTEDARKHVAAAIAVMQRGFPILLICIEFFCIVPIFLLATSDPWIWYALIFVHYEGIALSAVFLVLYIFPVLLRHVMRDLDNAVELGARMGSDVEQLKRVQAKLKRVLSDLRNQALFNICFASPFGILPGLQQIGAYWTPVAFTASAGAAMTAMYLEMPVFKSKSSAPIGGSSTQDSNKIKVGVDEKADGTFGSPASSFHSSIVSRAAGAPPSQVELAA